MSFAINAILNSIITETSAEDTPFYTPQQEDMMDYYDHIMSIKYPFSDTTDTEDSDEYNVYFEDWYAPLSYSNANSKTRHRNHRRNMVKDKQKLHAQKELTGHYGDTKWNSDGWLKSYAQEQYQMGNRRVRNTFDIPSGKGGYKKLNGKGIW